MFDHVGISVKDLAASVRFYTAALKPLGFELCSRDEASAGFGPAGEPALWLYAAKTSPRPHTHLAFRAKAKKAVDAFHAGGVEGGGKDNGKPGIRADYSPKYYAAFLHDPDGHNVEAVFLG